MGKEKLTIADILSFLCYFEKHLIHTQNNIKIDQNPKIPVMFDLK